MRMGIRQSKSANYSPARNRETGHSGEDRNARENEENVRAETVMTLSTSPVGLPDDLMKFRTISKK